MVWRLSLLVALMVIGPKLFAANVVFPIFQRQCNTDNVLNGPGPGDMGPAVEIALVEIAKEITPSNPPKTLMGFVITTAKGIVVTLAVTSDVETFQNSLQVLSKAQTIRVEGPCVTRLFVDGQVMPESANFLMNAKKYWVTEEGLDPTDEVKKPAQPQAPSVTPGSDGGDGNKGDL